MAAGLGEQLGQDQPQDLNQELGSLAALVALYAPYCDGVNRAARLEQALELMARGRTSGRRALRPAGGHDFEFSWSAAASPQELSSCILHFPALLKV